MRRRLGGAAWLVLVCAAALFDRAGVAADQKEDPVGLVLSAGGSKLLRANTETPLAARPGDLLFSGDGLRTGSAAASFLFCPARAIDTLSPSGEVRLETKGPKVRAGKVSEQPARACTLPQAVRVTVASQQHYGVTMTRGSKPEIAPIPRDQLDAGVRAELAPFDAALAANPLDAPALVGAATVLEKHTLTANALDVYYKLREQWPDAVWIKSKIFELEETLAMQAAAVTAPAPGGKTYALLVGISKYKKPELSLQFAHADASVFGKLLESPRGGGISPDDLLLLTDERATTAAVRNAFQDLLKRRTAKNDTVIILIAGHGTVEIPGSKNAFILTYDSDPQDLRSTALPMAELQSLFEEQIKRVGRALLFVDVCKAGTIGSIHNTTVSADVQRLGEVDGDLFGLLASRPREVSVEGPQFGGGHGVFSYFVMKGLEGAADDNQDGAVDATELIKYVTGQVAAATNNSQHPREFGVYNNLMKLSDIRKPGIELARAREMIDWRSGEPMYLASANVTEAMFGADDSNLLDRFKAALAAGNLRRGRPGNAFEALDRLKTQLTPEFYRESENLLRVALEDKAQEVLLRYVAGGQNPQSRQDFEQAARYMEAARGLTRESLFLEGREDFFQGRSLLFDKKFAEAAGLLEQSVRIDPGAAYGYNALGIAYLEQAQYEKAIPAFRDAARRARHWAYPLLNQALTYVEMGDYNAAIRTYQQAIRLTPEYSYLPYNLGLTYQRVNRRRDAETSYRKAMSLAPASPESYNALGALKAEEGNDSEAEKLYRDALARKPDYLPARHNLALLLAARGRAPEAVELWRANLRESPEHLPSLLSLAETLAAQGDNAGAAEQYRKALALKPEYAAARTALAGALAKTGDAEGALRELREASRLDPGNAAVFEQIGDLEAARGHTGEAQAAYRSALGSASERAARKRIEKKLKMAGR